MKWLALIAILITAEFSHAESALELQRYARIGRGSSSKNLSVNINDPDINSPKSVRFSADARKIYINSLEGGKTVVYSWPELQKLKVISHNFSRNDAHLFHGESTVFNYPYFTKSKDGDPNVFMGKPVESELSHGGRWLWIPYYRRGFDASAQSPSAVAIVDAETDEIVRVMPTGPIPKYVAASHDGRFVAITHWGDNTVGVIDTSSGDPNSFRYLSHLVVEDQKSQQGLAGTDRDKTCGFCLRGSVFSPDSNYLLVARMGGGGLAGFDVRREEYLGSIMNVKATPRHLVLSPDGSTLYVSSNASGYISKAPIKDVIDALIQARGRNIKSSDLRWKEVSVGKGARTIEITSDGKLVFVAVNNSSELVAVDAESMKVVTSIKIDPFAVGLAVAPDISAAVLTSQGRAGQGGGNAVNIIRIELGDYYKPKLRLK